MKKLLIVDDEESMLLILFYALQAEGVEVTTCNKLELAEEALTSTHFDLVITDIRMSGVNGAEGLELLKFIKERYPTEVIVMTGYGSPEIKTLAYELGAMHFFSKPMDLRELLLKVDAIGIPTKLNHYK